MGSELQLPVMTLAAHSFTSQCLDQSWQFLSCLFLCVVTGAKLLISQSGHTINTWAGKKGMPGSFQVPMDTVPPLIHWDSLCGQLPLLDCTYPMNRQVGEEGNRMESRGKARKN